MIRSYRNYSNHPISQTPPSSRKMVVVQAFKHPRLKLLFQYPNTFTLRSLDQGRRRSTSLQQFLWSYSEGYWISLAYYRCFQTSTRLLQSFSEYPLNSYCNWGAQTRVAKCFNSLCRARTGVAQHVLAVDGLAGAWTGVAKSVLSFNGLARAQMGLENVY